MNHANCPLFSFLENVSDKFSENTSPKEEVGQQNERKIGQCAKRYWGFSTTFVTYGVVILMTLRFVSCWKVRKHPFGLSAFQFLLLFSLRNLCCSWGAIPVGVTTGDFGRQHFCETFAHDNAICVVIVHFASTQFLFWMRIDDLVDSVCALADLLDAVTIRCTAWRLSFYGLCAHRQLLMDSRK